MRQLQADHVSEVTAKQVDVARLPGAGGSQPPKKVQAGDEDTTLEFSGRWAQKLDKEKIEMQERKQQWEMKLQQWARQAMVLRTSDMKPKGMERC